MNMKYQAIMRLISLVVLVIWMWHPTTTKGHSLKQPHDIVAAISWKPDGTQLAIGNYEGGVDIYSHQMTIMHTLPVGPVGDLAWSPDGTKLAVGVFETATSVEVQIWDMDTLNHITTMPGQGADFIWIDWSPDSTKLAINIGEVQIWDISSATLVDTLMSNAVILNHVAWSPDGCCIVSEGYPADETANMIIVLWDSISGNELLTLSDTGLLSSVVWSPDSTHFAVGSDGAIQIRDAQTGEILNALPGDGQASADLDWKGSTIVTTNDIGDGTSLLYVWDAVSGQLLNTIHSQNLIFTLALSPDGTRLVYGGDDGTLENVPSLGTTICTPAQTVSVGDVAGLISAINTANSNSDADVIGLETGTYTFTTAHIPLNALPAITSDITICSTEGATLTRQAGSPLFGFFEVNAGGNLTLENLTLSGGDVGNDTGGALVNNEGGTVTLNNVTFTNNHANTGGAIDNESGSLTLIDSTFENNQADYGGAIDNDTGGTLSISGSTFTSNTAELDGGAIHNDGGTLTVTDSTFTFNTAGRYGGALDNTGQATLNGSTFSGSAAAWSGGAVRNANTLTVNNGSVLENNTATLGENNEGWGGGIYNTSSGTATISASTLSENAAIQGGGIRNHGDLILNENTQLTGNSASSRGGGIYNAGGTIQLTDSAFLNNTAAGDGGAIYTTSLGSQVTITGSTVSGNTSGASGGAIRNSQSMTITDSVFSNNTATSSYGSLYLTSSSTTTAHNSCFSGNSATSVGHTGTTMQDFTGNWWGAADGPSGSGPGSGDAVNNRINYASFLTTGCPHP
ncbi:MAG: hypothetical protein F9K28_10690 [Bacteroidetes bacterium]|nr:MAG: hypothetical protein F9K28_10690 [Bacteroidota bacterium]